MQGEEAEQSRVYAKSFDQEPLDRGLFGFRIGVVALPNVRLLGCGNFARACRLRIMVEITPAPLVRLLARSVLNGCAAGMIAGIGVAYWKPFVGALVAAPTGGLGWFTFLFVCAEVGAVVALAIAMLPEPSA